MDKICIAKRRASSRQDYGAPVAQTGTPNVSCRKDHGEDVISVKVPVEQGTVLRSSGEEPLAGVSSDGVRYEVNQQKNGMLVFNIYLNKVESMSLLKTTQVCQMLQIGKRALMGLVRTGHLRSYLVGSRRRFLFTDVVEYLTKAKEEYDEETTHAGLSEYSDEKSYMGAAFHDACEEMVGQSASETATSELSVGGPGLHVLARAESGSVR